MIIIDNIPTQQKPCQIKLTFSGNPNASAAIKLFDRDSPQSTYLQRSFMLDKGKEIFVPLPVSPQKSCIHIISDSPDMALLEVEYLDLKEKPQLWDDKKWDFWLMVKDFSVNASYLTKGIYESKERNFVLVYDDNFNLVVEQQGYSHEVSVYNSAFVDWAKGIFYLNSEKFKNMTVSRRVFLLWHEYYHWALKSTDEEIVNEHAIETCLSLGLSKIEIINALYQVYAIFLEKLDKKTATTKEKERVDWLIKIIKQINEFN